MKPHKHAQLIKAWADGQKVEVLCHGSEWRDVGGSPSWTAANEYRIKPEPPAKVYPSNALAHSIMCTAYLDKCKELGYTSCSVESVALNEVANAALRHAIDSRQVIALPLPGVMVSFDLAPIQQESAIRAKLIELGWVPPEKRAARDIAIAEAVRDACRNNFTDANTAIKISAAYGRISNVSLDGIIARVVG